MAIIFAIIAAVALASLTWALLRNKRLENLVAERDAEVERLRQYCLSESTRIQAEAQAAVAEAQKLIDQQFEEMKQESERVRQHYETEAHHAQLSAEALIAKVQKELEPLRKYEGLLQPEVEAQRILAEALIEAKGLQQEARTLLEQARSAAADERSQAIRKAKEIHQQAEALLTQATRDAGRIVEDANKRAEQIGGDAYIALRDKEMLDEALKAIRNVIDGYGDRYIVPTRSLLDELASDFGHTASGESLRAAREQSRRMVQESLAAECDYVEANRRETAVRFVIDAFNGRVDAILSRTKHDNFGTLQQEIRDAFSLVNMNGKAFRDARILPTYLDARLAELKWAVVAQELRLKEREEQQRIREQMREEEKVRREYERAIREAGMKEELTRKALEQARLEAQQASAEERGKLEQRIAQLNQRLEEEMAKKRALSMAQQTRVGNVYIISNVGSFGENVFKIGLTRRLIPQDRIDELGDSSVPFAFDVHAMIHSEDSPALEAKLHKHFVLMQMNKVNHRKEFFRVDLKHIQDELKKLGLEAAWTTTAKASEYRESLAIDKAIKDNPAKRDAWIKRQWQMELHDLEEAKTFDETVVEDGSAATPDASVVQAR